MKVAFNVSDLVAAYPTEAEAVLRYAPQTGLYAGANYSDSYKSLSTEFDDTVVLADEVGLREKILLEYKTAKSTDGRRIDGNAHERLSYQIMQYLEIAGLHPPCSLTVIANGAFVRYRNKYHVSFHTQIDRLASQFACFSAELVCTEPEYGRFLIGLMAWLFDGTPRGARRAP